MKDKSGKAQGFDYYLSKETIKRFQEKSPELRLEWLYLGNLFRKNYPKDIIRLHNKFREGSYLPGIKKGGKW